MLSTTLDETLGIEDDQLSQQNPRESPDDMTPAGFLEQAHRILGQLPADLCFENLKPYWDNLQKAYSVLAHEEDALDIGWRLRLDTPQRPTATDIEERVALIMRDARESLPDRGEEEKEQYPGENKLISYALGFSRIVEQHPRLLIADDLAEAVAALRKQVVELTR